jgi:DNA mismatch endonuclease (patch repair protein)
MADTLTPQERTARMARVRGKDTGAELAVRHVTHGLGYRYRLHVGGLPGRPDLVFRPRRKVIFVHGCFWHRHEDADCRLARLPKSRLDFWLPKLEANRLRDRRDLEKLDALGWRSLVIWECVIRDRARLARTIAEFLEAE